MEQQAPLTQKQLREIAARRRGDQDVRVLLLEIKRLRDLTLEAFRRGSRAFRYTEDAHDAHVLASFAELFEEEPAILESMLQSQHAPPGPERRWPHMSEEREAKLLARMQRE